MKILHISLLAGFGAKKKFGMSGGDRIHIEFLNEIQNNEKITILCTKKGRDFFKSKRINENIKFIIVPFAELGIFYLDLFFLHLISFFYPLFFFLKFRKYKLIICASDIFPDFFIGYFISIILNKKAIFSFFLKASSPLNKRFPYKGIRIFYGSIYYFIQKIVISLIKIKKNKKIIFASDYALKYFPNLDKNDYFITYGGIHSQEINHALQSINNKKYECVFVGRFHEQKGVIELIEIWKNVIAVNQMFKLAIIGNGPCENKMKKLVKKYNLEKKIDFLGFLDGEEKNAIFINSKVFIHPPIFDTGGMALAEAMSFGIPGVVFDLEGYQFAYPYGITKVSKYDCKEYADKINYLLNDENEYQKLSQEAYQYINSWDWKKQAFNYKEFLNN